MKAAHYRLPLITHLHHATPKAFASRRARQAFLVLFSVLCPLSSVFSQGSLTPPGAPAPTMKTLDQVEPRTPISSLPFVISSSGSYYLTGNLTAAASTTAISVNADSVTIDLRGFTLSGTSTTGTGIFTPNAQSNVIVENGIIRSFANGINLGAVAGGRLERITASDCGGPILSGSLKNGSNFLVRDCMVTAHNGSGTSSAGIILGFANVASNCAVKNGTGTAQGFLSTAGFETMLNCSASGNPGDGFNVGSGATLTNCAGHQNGGIGISVGSDSTLENCSAESNTGNGITTASRCALSNCTARLNFGVAGISAGAGSTLTRCSVGGNMNPSNSSAGISVGNGCTLIGCAADANTTTFGTITANTGVGIKSADNCVLKDCASQTNKGDGIQVGDYCQLIGCTSNSNGNAATGSGIIGGLRTIVLHNNASLNQKSGIVVLGASLVQENNVGQNGAGGAAAGIDSSGGSGSRIEANVARNNTGTGILGASNDVIIRNYSFSNTTNYNPTAGTNIGPIGSASTATSPFANFQ